MLQTDSLKQEVVSHTENLQTSQSEIKNLKSRLQALKIELQTQLSMVRNIITHITTVADWLTGEISS